MSADKSPIRVRGTMHSTTVDTALTESRAEPNGLPVKHWIRLTMPNIEPSRAPYAGPRITAPTATGITRNVISIAPTRKNPIGVKPSRKISAMRIAACVSLRSDDFVFFCIIYLRDSNPMLPPTIKHGCGAV